MNIKDPTRRLMQWAQKLKNYKKYIQHQAKEKHQNGDGLLRLPIAYLEIAKGGCQDKLLLKSAQ